MKNLAFWKRFSNISTYGLGLVVIIHIFFKKHITLYLDAISVLEIILLSLSLISELIEFLTKRNLKRKISPPIDGEGSSIEN